MLSAGMGCGRVVSRRGEELAQRRKACALRIIRLVAALPARSRMGRIIGDQLGKSGTSVAAQYRAVRRARSNAEFFSKLESSLQELDETAYWLELLAESQIVPARRLKDLQSETEQLTAIFVSSVHPVKRRRVRH